MSNVNVEIITDVQEQNKYMDKVEVLERVGTLAMLPGDIGYATTQQVADFFGVARKDIAQYAASSSKVGKHWADELKSDGVKVVNKDDLAVLTGTTAKSGKGYALIGNVKIAHTSNTIWTRRSVLRLGMILQNDVAKQIRNYLLNIEEKSTMEQKVEAIVQTGIQNNVQPNITVDLMNQIAARQAQAVSTATAQVLVEAIQDIKNDISDMKQTVVNQTEAHDAHILEMADMLEESKLRLDLATEHMGFNSIQTMKCTAHLKQRLSKVYSQTIMADDWIYKSAQKSLFKAYGVRKWESIPSMLFNNVWADIDSIDEVESLEFVGRVEFNPLFNTY